MIFNALLFSDFERDFDCGFDLVWVILIWSRMIVMWFGMALGGFDVFGVDVE